MNLNNSNVGFSSRELEIDLHMNRPQGLLFKGNFAEKKHYLQKRCKKSTLAFLQK
jgi:hypothetical protein